MYEHITEIKVPWSDVIRDDFHVTVYRSPGSLADDHLLFVPKYNAAGVIAEAFSDAHAYGRKKVEISSWSGYEINMSYTTADPLAWPHVHLRPIAPNQYEMSDGK